MGSSQRWGLGAYPTSGRPGSGELPRDQRCRVARARWSGIGKGSSRSEVVAEAGPSRRHQYGGTGVRRGCCCRACSAEVDVLLAVVAVVADVEDLVVGQAADGTLGVGLLRDMHPQGGAALAGVAEVQLDGVGVVGEAAHGPPSQSPLGQEPLVVVQDLLAGVDAQVGLGEPSFGQRGLGPLGLVSVLEDGDQEPPRVEYQWPSTKGRVLVGHAHGPDNFMLIHDGSLSLCCDWRGTRVVPRTGLLMNRLPTRSRHET